MSIVSFTMIHNIAESCTHCRYCGIERCSEFIEHSVWKNLCLQCRCDLQVHLNSTAAAAATFFAVSTVAEHSYGSSRSHIYENLSDFYFEYDDDCQEDDCNHLSLMGTHSSEGLTVDAALEEEQQQRLRTTPFGGVSSTQSSTLSSLECDSVSTVGSGSNRRYFRANYVPSSKLNSTTATATADLSYRQSTSDDDSGCALDDYRYVWVPSNLRPDLVHRFFNRLPVEKVPYLNSIGEKWRSKQLAYQLPPQDNEPAYCRHLSADEQRELKRFSKQRKKDSFGRGSVKVIPYDFENTNCSKCSQTVYPGDLGVFLEHNIGSNNDNNKAVWHPSCFVCVTCEELLVDLIYFHKDFREVYCGRHHAELWKPRCVACDELILADECTEAEKKTWHVHHFVCFECDAALGGAQYVMRDSRPFCLTCFQNLFADRCATCRAVISLEEAKMNHGDRFWHADNRCFSCAACRLPLLGRPFLPKEPGLFCSPTCFKKISYVVTLQGSPNRRKIRPHNVNTTTTTIPASDWSMTEAGSTSVAVRDWSRAMVAAVENEAADESDYASISPRVQRTLKNNDKTAVIIRGGTSKEDCAANSRSSREMIMFRSIAPQENIPVEDNESFCSHRSMPNLCINVPQCDYDESSRDLIGATSTRKLQSARQSSKTQRKSMKQDKMNRHHQPVPIYSTNCRRLNSANSVYDSSCCSSSVVTTKLVARKETTFGIEPSTAAGPASTIRAVRFSDSLVRKSKDSCFAKQLPTGSGHCRHELGGFNTCNWSSSSSSSSDEDEDSFSYNLAHCQKDLARCGGQSFSGHRVPPQQLTGAINVNGSGGGMARRHFPPVSSSRGHSRTKSANKCIVS